MGNSHKKYQTITPEVNNEYVLKCNGKKCIYYGLIKYGLPNGYGKLYMDDQKRYVGFWKNGKYDGLGTMYRANGTIGFIGDFRNGELFEGILYYENGVTPFFNGKFLNNKGISDIFEDIVYQGEYLSIES